ncbi:hypothetical protein P278_32150 [Zhouia amylolytica AD3]|uniref:Uncharacterized protein n=1 Tax=Zhouia amylolytica AD3 TaxID=1286632 RepID=W2UI43_9FLAO|nr:hypothetical protein P278_32150 [Zhouia amylolytica AD3]
MVVVALILIVMVMESSVLNCCGDMVTWQKDKEEMKNINESKKDLIMDGF